MRLQKFYLMRRDDALQRRRMIDFDNLPDDPAALRQLLHEAAAEIDKLERLIRQLQRHQFGRRSEQLSQDQLALAMEDLEQSQAAAEAEQAAKAPERKPPRTKPARNRGALPKSLPRIEVVIDIADKSCPCCGGALHQIGEDQSEMLDFVPARLRVRVIRRPRYACRACEQGVVQAPAPERPIDGGMASEALIAHVLISKYADHLPLYRQAQIFARHGIDLAGFAGVLQADGYSGFKSLLGARPPDQMKLAFCWAHVRRKLYDVHASNGSLLAAEALRRIAELYRIVAELRGRPAEFRRAERQARSKPRVEALHGWLEQQLARISGKSELAEAMRYALRHWAGLCVFLDDGRVEIDDNVVERSIRPVALGRKNALFAGSDGGAEHWAIAMTLIETAKLNGVEPFAWLCDVLERVVSGQCKQHQLATLLPWNWRPAGENGATAVAA